MMRTAELNEATRAAGADSEGATLIDDLRHWTTVYFGYPTRQANLESWGRMEAGQLQAVHGNWKKLMMRPRLVRGGAL
jgi:hypothetical protein